MHWSSSIPDSHLQLPSWVLPPSIGMCEQYSLSPAFCCSSGSSGAPCEIPSNSQRFRQASMEQAWRPRDLMISGCAFLAQAVIVDASLAARALGLAGTSCSQARSLLQTRYLEAQAHARGDDACFVRKRPSFGVSRLNPS